MNDKLQAIYQYRRLSQRIATAGQPSQAQLADIARAQFEVVINLGLSDADYSLKDEGAIVKSRGLVYEHIPVAWDCPTERDLNRFFHIMTKHQGKKVFIHCAANKRVSVFITLFRILQEGWSRDGATRALHQMWLPNDTWQSFIDNVLNTRSED